MEEDKSTVLKKAMTIEVKTAEHLETATEIAKEVKEVIKEIDKRLDPGIKKAHQKHKDLIAKKKEAVAPWEKAENRLKQIIGDFLAEMERIRKEEEARRAKEAAEKREKELAEANVRIDELIGDAASIDEQIFSIDTKLTEEITDIERDALFARRSALCEALDRANEEMARIAMKAAEAEKSDPEGTVIKFKAPSGISAVAAPPKVDIVNPMALVRAIADGSVPIGVIGSWNTSFIGRLASGGLAIPGVKITTAKTIRLRS